MTNCLETRSACQAGGELPLDTIHGHFLVEGQFHDPSGLTLDFQKAVHEYPGHALRRNGGEKCVSPMEILRESGFHPEGHGRMFPFQLTLNDEIMSLESTSIKHEKISIWQVCHSPDSDGVMNKKASVNFGKEGVLRGHDQRAPPKIFLVQLERLRLGHLLYLFVG